MSNIREGTEYTFRSNEEVQISRDEIYLYNMYMRYVCVYIMDKRR